MVKPFLESLAQRFAYAAAGMAGIAMLVIVVISMWLINHEHAASVKSLLKKETDLQALTVSDNLGDIAGAMSELAKSNLIANALIDATDRDKFLIPYLSRIQNIQGKQIDILFTDFKGGEIARNSTANSTANSTENSTENKAEKNIDKNTGNRARKARSDFNASDLAWLRDKLAGGQAASRVQSGDQGDELLAVEFVVLPPSNEVEGALLYKINLGVLGVRSGMQLLHGQASAQLLQSQASLAVGVAAPQIYQNIGFAIVARVEPERWAVDWKWLSVLFILAGSMMAMVITLGLYIGKKLTQDLRQLQGFTQQVVDAGFDASRVEGADSLEVAGLAQSINSMLERLRQQHDKLSESEERFRSLFEYSDVGMNVRNADSRYVAVNPAFARMMGYSQEALLGMHFNDITHPDSAESSLANVETLLTGQCDHFQMEKKFIRKEGSTLWADVSVSAVRDTAGQVVSFIGVTQDITARKQAEAELVRFKSILDNTLDMIFMFEPETLRYVYANEGAILRMGYSRQELYGMTAFDVKPFTTEAAFRQRLLPLLSGEHQSLHFEGTHRRKDGTDFPISAFLQLVTQSDGTRLFVNIVQDITERKQAQDTMLGLNASLEERVQQRTTQLQASNRNMEEFAYSVAHDLRQPFIAIGGFSGLLARTITDERATYYIERIKAGVHKAGELTDSLLALANLSRVQLHLQPVDLSAIARGVMNDLQKGSPARQASVCIEPGLVVQADPVLIQQMMHKLLSNAWKFTSRRSHTEISFGLLPAQAAADVLGATPVYVVKDNGEGFDMAQAHKLFRSFQRLHDAQEFPGAGADLVKVQRIMERHHGQVWAESAPGEGARFFFKFGQ
ncbi:MAG: PAS domain S-box protein [Polaromonas sp.]|nr:MAG: PAS domain S-box protein [Polaromonas sp.]